MAKLDHQMSQEEREKERDRYVASQKPVEPEGDAELVYDPNPGRKTSAPKPASTGSKAGEPAKVSGKAARKGSKK